MSLPGGGDPGGCSAAMDGRRSGGRPEDGIGQQMTGGSGKTVVQVVVTPPGGDERDSREGSHREPWDGDRILLGVLA
jgi:hypothetical protein